MTIRVSRVDGVEIPAAQDRRALYGGWTTGTLASGDGLVEAQASPNMTVKVAPITGLLIDDGISFGDGKLVFESDASVNVTIATSDATNPRIDLVVAKVTGVEFGGSDAFTLEAVAGTPAASPSAPATPTRAYVLAEVRVDAGVTTIQSNKITDRRARSALQSRVGCRLHKTASSIGSGSLTAVTWSDEDEDTHGFISAPGTTITIPAGQSGPYAITGYTVASSSITGRGFVELTVTTAQSHMPAEYRNVMEAAEDRGLVTASIPLLAGDSFTFRVYHSSSGARTFESFLSCYRTSV